MCSNKELLYIKSFQEQTRKNLCEALLNRINNDCITDINIIKKLLENSIVGSIEDIKEYESQLLK